MYGSINIATNIRHKLHCKRLGCLGEIHNYTVDSLTQRRISAGRLLEHPQSQRMVQA